MTELSLVGHVRKIYGTKLLTASGMLYNLY